MKYATAYDGKVMARALGVSLPISTKKTVELCSFIRGRELSKVVRLLEGVLDEKVAIPFRKYAKGGTGHKPGIGPGRYPKNACVEVIKLLRQAEANAKNKGLDASRLAVSNILAKKAAQSWHYGRQRRRRMKSTHVEVVVSEMEHKPGQLKAAAKVKAVASAPAAAAANPHAEAMPQVSGVQSVKK